MGQNEVLINIYKWENAKDVMIKITDHISDEEDLQILNLIWRRLKANDSFNFEIDLIEISRQVFQLLLKAKPYFQISKLKQKSKVYLLNEKSFFRLKA